ncbi:hypothetical protein AgCh_019175 [Apium graveolens]
MPATSTHSLPLLTTMVTSHGSTNRPWNLATLTHYLCRSSSRQSGAVIENLEQLQTACWPATVMFLLLCKMAFIVASIYVMIASHVNEDPDQVQFRVWVVGYAIKCCVHGVWIGLECKKKWDRLWISDSESSEAAREENLGSDERDVVLNIDPVDVVQNDHEEEQTRYAAFASVPMKMERCYVDSHAIIISIRLALSDGYISTRHVHYAKQPIYSITVTGNKCLLLEVLRGRNQSGGNLGSSPD